MSRENVETVRWAYEQGLAQRRTDIPGVEERFAAGYRFHARSGFPGRTEYSLAELADLWADLDATFADHRLVPIEYEELDSSHVLVTLEQTARLRGSDHVITDVVYQLWRVREGRAQNTRTFSEKADAVEAAGRADP